MSDSDRAGQYDLFCAGPQPAREHKAHGVANQRVFVAPARDELYLNMTPLGTHLRETGLRAPFVVAELLDRQDWSEFEQRYSSAGRAPFAPRCMMGIILYGIMQGVSSLRALERFARVDLGCMWVSGGIKPDHAVLGRFIRLHEASLTSSFFEQLTAAVLRAGGGGVEQLAGDGTVVEAACSHYRLLHEEALQQQLERAREHSERAPDHPDHAERLEQAQRCSEHYEQRKQARKNKGRSSASLQISPTEPEAMVQPLKRKRGYAPSYKPTVLANDQRVITAFHVDPGNEGAALQSMLTQSARLGQAQIEQLSLDSGFFNAETLQWAVQRGLNLLCPPPQAIPGRRRRDRKYFAKFDFHYEAEHDRYRCPAGAYLYPVERARASARKRAYTRYSSHACLECPWRKRCTPGRKRRIDRYDGDEEKDAMRMVMNQPRARARYRRHQGQVEPVFSALRLQQGLERFRRRHLAGVRVEFALHALAHNLSRAVALLWLAFCALYRPLSRFMSLWVAVESIHHATVVSAGLNPGQAMSAS